MIDNAGQRIRELTGGASPVKFDEATSNAMAEYKARCFNRNNRGKCANPNVLDEDGQMMSWEDYDAHKAKGINPRDVWGNSPWQKPQHRGGQMRAYGPQVSSFRGRP